MASPDRFGHVYARRRDAPDEVNPAQSSAIVKVRKVRRAGNQTSSEYLVRWCGFDEQDDSWEPPSRFASWVNGRRTLAEYQSQHSGAQPPPDLVYKQVKESPTKLCYYDLVSAAEVLHGARIDDSDLGYARVVLLPEHAAQTGGARTGCGTRGGE